MEPNPECGPLRERRTRRERVLLLHCRPRLRMRRLLSKSNLTSSRGNMALFRMDYIFVERLHSFFL